MDKESLFLKMTSDQALIETWNIALKDYDPTEEPELGLFTRYFDLRELPPVLKKGGILVDSTETHYRFKSSHSGLRYWTITRDFVLLFQKRTFASSLIRMANQIVSEKIDDPT
jgi:hypothetical protein